MSELIWSYNFWAGIGTAFSIAVPSILFFAYLRNSSRNLNIHRASGIIANRIVYEDENFSFTLGQKQGHRIVRDIILFENRTGSVIDHTDFSELPTIRIDNSVSTVFDFRHLTGNLLRNSRAIKAKDGWRLEDFKLPPNEAYIFSILHDGEQNIEIDCLLKNTSQQNKSSLYMPSLFGIFVWFCTFCLSIIAIGWLLYSFSPSTEIHEIPYANNFFIFLMVMLTLIGIPIFLAFRAYVFVLSAPLRRAKEEINKKHEVFDLSIFGKKRS